MPLASQQVKFEVLSVANSLAIVNWRWSIKTIWRCSIPVWGAADPGSRRSRGGGQYTLTVGDDRYPGIGIYSFRLSPP